MKEDDEESEHTKHIFLGKFVGIFNGHPMLLHNEEHFLDLDEVCSRFMDFS